MITSTPEPQRADAIIVGGGAAGLSAALALAPRRVVVITKAAFGAGGSSPVAQGGIAAAMSRDDSPALHARDTLDAAAGLAARDVVDLLTTAGPKQIERLVALGAQFDRTADGELALGREAAHSRRRILHAHGDSTGAEVMRTLSLAVQQADHVEVLAHTFVSDLIREGTGRDGGRVVGVCGCGPEGSPFTLLAPAVVVATGGIGQLYAFTTNPEEATGDGIAMAARAGALLADMEFVQFHPTALVTARDPLPLLTEALRGEGAVLITEDGRRFMPEVHPLAELAPRDVVARAIWAEQQRGLRVFLDAREAVGTRFPERFPTVFGLCIERGLDPRFEPLPVSPAAHYFMGGIDVDTHGRSSLPGLWACGEVTSTGAHGANRLASNSLLEALVFGARVALDIASRPHPLPSGQVGPTRVATAKTDDEEKMRRELRVAMWENVGLVRNATSLQRMLVLLDTLAAHCPAASGELANMLTVAHAITAAAIARPESRGGHYRDDFPDTSPELASRHKFVASPWPAPAIMQRTTVASS